MPSVNELKKSKFLTQRDVTPDILVTIKGLEEVNIAKEGAEAEYRWALYFNEEDKPLILNSTNGQIIAKITGQDEMNDWVGHKIVLYHDPTVSFGGKLVGGIRVRMPRNAKAAPAKATPKPAPEEPKDFDPDNDDGIPF